MVGRPSGPITPLKVTYPPSINKSVPVTKAASSEARYAAHDNVRGHDQFAGHVPSRLVHQQRRDGARRVVRRNLRKMQVHRFNIAAWRDEPGALAFLGTEGAKNIGGGCALIM